MTVVDCTPCYGFCWPHGTRAYCLFKFYANNLNCKVCLQNVNISPSFQSSSDHMTLVSHLTSFHELQQFMKHLKLENGFVRVSFDTIFVVFCGVGFHCHACQVSMFIATFYLLGHFHCAHTKNEKFLTSHKYVLKRFSVCCATLFVCFKIPLLSIPGVYGWPMNALNPGTATHPDK